MMLLKRALALVAATPLIFAAAAVGHRSEKSRVHNMRHIAQNVYGPFNNCDVSFMKIPINRERGFTRRTGFLGGFTRWGGPPPWAGCRFIVDDRRWTTEYLCRVLAGHEPGHASGLPHVNDRSNIMWPGRLPYWEPCANGAAQVKRGRK